MESRLRAPFLERIQGAIPGKGQRVLCLAPPGELAEPAGLCLHAVGPEGLVVAPVRGEPFLTEALPPELRVHDGHPGEPGAIEGPFDLVLSWGSMPFIDELDGFLGTVRSALRPGGKLCFDLPAYGFSPILQASHPLAKDWSLPGADEFRASLEEAEFRNVRCAAWVDVREHRSLGDLVDAIVMPFPLHYEGRAGKKLLHELRRNLSEVFEKTEKLSFALRRVRASAMR